MASSETINGVELRHHYARANGILQHYVIAGSGEPVVLLHGFAQTWRMWRRDVIPALARDYTVIAPDMRGVGDTDRPVDGYEKRSMAEDLHGLLEHLGTGPVLLGGHDFGAAVAYAYAAAHRDAVRKLAIMEMIMPGFGYEQAMQVPFATDGLGRAVWHLFFHDAGEIAEALIGGRERMYLNWFHRTFAYNPAAFPVEDLDEYERSYAAPGGLRALAYYRTHWTDAEHNKESAKQPLTIPVLALGGAGFLGPIVEQGMSALAGNVQGEIIPECGHWVTEEQPEYIIAALKKFFAS
jgi:pimeloyl-ACP methyl ester carboxylesterase